MNFNQEDEKGDTKPVKHDRRSLKSMAFYVSLYLTGIATFLIMIADPFTMSTYFSDNSLLPGLVNREFSLGVEAEYYLKDLEKLNRPLGTSGSSLAASKSTVTFIKHELEQFGLEVYEQNFQYNSEIQLNGTNIYSFIRGERSTSSESIVLCVPYSVTSSKNTLPSVGLSLALAKYFSTKSYWAKDLIILFVDHDHYGTSAFLDSYYDINFRSDFKRQVDKKDGFYYDSLENRSGPMQAAIVLELYGRQTARINIKIQGAYGQLPNLDLFNLIIELSARESVTPYFHNKSLPYDLTQEDLYRHHLETAISFMTTQATMKSDGLHGLFLSYAVQALTLEGPEFVEQKGGSHIIAASLLNVGRLLEGVFRSLNNLTERFNRSYYFYIILSLRRFTSIGYYMIAFGLVIAPVPIKVYNEMLGQSSDFNPRNFLLLASALTLSLLSTFNISAAMIASVAIVPILIIL